MSSISLLSAGNVC